MLFVLNGAKALTKPVKDVWGRQALTCLRHSVGETSMARSESSGSEFVKWSLLIPIELDARFQAVLRKRGAKVSPFVRAIIREYA
jgi:hypothetical protein